MLRERQQIYTALNKRHQHKIFSRVFDLFNCPIDFTRLTWLQSLEIIAFPSRIQLGIIRNSATPHLQTRPCSNCKIRTSKSGSMCKDSCTTGQPSKLITSFVLRMELSHFFLFDQRLDFRQWVSNLKRVSKVFGNVVRFPSNETNKRHVYLRS